MARPLFPRPLRAGRVLALLVAVMLGVAGCGPAAPSLDPALRIAPTNLQPQALTGLPAGIGRGYPVALVGATGSADGQSGQSGPPAVGAPAPDFALQLDDGRHLFLSDLRGAPVLLNFWATWCGPCQIEMPELLRAVAEDSSLTLLAANLREEPAAIEPFADAFAMQVPILLDPDGALADLYSVRGLPVTLFIDADGVVQAIHAGVLLPKQLRAYLEQVQ